MSPWRRRLRRTRFALISLIATAVILMAAVVGVSELSLPWIVAHPDHVEKWLGERLGRPVTIGRLDGSWVDGGPELRLDDVRIAAGADGTPALVVPHAELALDFYAWLHRNRSWNEFRLVGLDLTLTHGADGAWSLSGQTQSSDENESGALDALGTVVLRDLRLEVIDVARDLKLRLGASELRLVNGGRIKRALGKVRSLDTQSPPIDLIAEIAPDERAGTLYLGGRGLDFGQLLAGHPLHGIETLAGQGDAQIWVTWSNGNLADARAKLDFRELVLGSTQTISIERGAFDHGLEIAPRTSLSRLALVARWQRAEDGWSADVADLTIERRGETLPPARASIVRSGGSEAPRFHILANDLPFEPVGSVALLTDDLPPGARSWLYRADPSGALAAIDFDWSSRDDFSVDAALARIGFRSAGAAPGIERVDMRVRGDAQGVVATIPDQALRLDYPHVFRKPLRYTRFGGEIAAYRVDDAWRGETDRITFDGEGYSGEARGAIDFDDDRSRPKLDVYAAVTAQDIRSAKLFWPINVMPPPAVNWLDRALVSGSLENARIVLRGDLDNWPFRDNSGRFEARGEITDTTLAFSDEWPAAEHLSATAVFVGTGMDVAMHSAVIEHNAIIGGQGTIADLGEPVLELSAKGAGTGKSLLDLVRASPVGRSHADVLTGIDIGGRGDVGFRMNLPIKNAAAMKLDGAVDLIDADLHAPQWELAFANTRGKVRFGETGFGADDLATEYEHSPVKLSVDAGTGFVRDAHHAFEARLQGDLTAATLLTSVPILAPIVPHLPGASAWNIAFAVDATDNGATAPKRLTLASDLLGTAIDLPAPLAKGATESQAFSMTLDVPFASAPFEAKLGEHVTARGRLPGLAAPFAARVDFGGRSAAPLPPYGFSIGGQVAELDAGGWIEVVGGGATGTDAVTKAPTEEVVEKAVARVAAPTSAGATTAGAKTKAPASRVAAATSIAAAPTAKSAPPAATTAQDAAPGLLHDLSLKVDQFIFGGRHFGASAVAIKPTRDMTTITFDGQALAGSVDVPTHTLAQRGLTAQLQRLYVPELPTTADSGDDDAGTLAGIVPANLPTLHLWVGDFKLGKASFGEAQWESYPTAEGMHIEQLESHSPNVDMEAQGEWTGSAKDNRSHLTIDMTAQNLGRMLDALGYAGVIDGGQTIAHIDANWRGPPSAFALPRLTGTLGIKVAEGRILEVDTPGVGRVFGLLSLREIPRRLSLDFSDFFKSGFSFNSIVGTFKLENGNAVTDDLTIKSPAADIDVRGRTGLRARDYDQEMVVTPHAGATLPVVGALAAGPVGAAAGLVVQGLLNRPISAATRLRYHLTGSWDNPVSTLIAKENPRAQKAAQKAKPETR